jgi:carboxymethylenebutenolidase
MSDQTVSVSTPDGAMDLYEAGVDGDAKGAVIVIQEAFGVNEHIRDVTRRFAAAGYHAVAPSIFHRAGGGTIEDYDNIDFNEMMKLFEGVNDDAILTDVDAALDQLRQAGFADSRIGIVGYCFGGRVTFLVAARRALGAAVTFYGGGIVTAGHFQFPTLIDEAATLRTPWLGLFGDEDGGIPVEDVERLRGAVAAAPVDTEIVRYPGAGHGFHCDVRSAYHEPSARDGWARTLDWFERHLHS